MNTDTTPLTMRPSTCDSAATFFHSGSAWKSAQFFFACSRLSCEMM